MDEPNSHTRIELNLLTHADVVTALAAGYQGMPSLIERFCGRHDDARVQDLVYAVLTVLLYELRTHGLVVARKRFDPALQVPVLGYELTPAGERLARGQAA